MHHDLQINRLRALVTVVDHGGFRKAAEVLHVTQPAVSQQIRQLGSLIKGPIFVSTGRELRLSPRGEELLGYARRIVTLNDEAVDRFVPSVGNRILSVGVVEQFIDALPDFLQMLSKRIPETRVSVQTGLSESLEEQVSSGQLDVALLLQKHHRTKAATHELGHMRLDWFGRPAYREGAALPLTLFTEPCTLRSNIIEAFDSSNVPWRVGYEGEQFSGLRAATKAGLGVACLIANGDELWGLPKAMTPTLPSPPGPLPVTVAHSGTAATDDHLPIADKAFRHALRDYPFE